MFNHAVLQKELFVVANSHHDCELLITFDTTALYEFLRDYHSQALPPKSSRYINTAPKLANDMFCQHKVLLKQSILILI